MSARPPASLPPAGLPGLDPAWSRVVGDWHVLDRPAAGGRSGSAPVATLLCVHGNPTWSYLWRRVVAAAPSGWRVVAPDQLGMGFSARTERRPLRLADRVAALGALTRALGVDGPVVLLAHDWGGPIGLGWALEHREQIAGIVLANTAVSQPTGTAAPALIRLAGAPGLRAAVCVRTPAFVRGATWVSRPLPPAAVRAAYAAPYGSADRRGAVGDFVADIPLTADHPSAPALTVVREGLAALADVPALLLWGPRDPVFGDEHLRDLRARLPQAEVQRYEGASHLVPEDAPGFADDVARWLADLEPALARDARPPSGDPRNLSAALGSRSFRGSPGVKAAEPAWRPLTAALQERAAADPGAPALVELAGSGRLVTAGALAARVRELAAGLADAGVEPGQRVALLVPPGADLAAALYACWRLGAVVVVADAGLGLARMGRALRGAEADVVVGIARGLAAATAMRVPGRRVLAGPVPAGARRALGVEATLADLARRGRALLAAGHPLSDEPGPDADAAVVFTSGATGPPKGVRYRHGQVRAQLDVLTATYALGPDDRLVAAFAPFALYGPALGIASAVPDVDVTAPGSLTARQLAAAAAAIDATVVFAAPAALRNVVATADALDDAERDALARTRLLVSAGAPVPRSLLARLGDVLPKAEMHTPYGMTEALPVTDVSLTTIVDAGPGDGVCVGAPVAGVEVAVSPLDALGRPGDELSTDPGLTGELCVRAAHVKAGYDRLWATERRASRTAGWHRTGDVGHLDTDGRLWVEGRLAHVVPTAHGVVTPVGVEQRAESLDGVVAAAAVGVGPVGTQQLVVVVEPSGARGTDRTAPLADATLVGAVRAAVGRPVAAVLVTDRLPVDIRHQSKVDRARVARWADTVLAGGRAGRRP